MAKLMMGTEEVLKVMMGTEEVTSLFMGSEEIPSSGSPEPQPAVDYSTMPFTIEALGSGNVTITASNTTFKREFYYSVNGGAKTLFRVNTDGQSVDIPVDSGDTVAITVPADQSGISSSTGTGVSFKSSCNINAYGNILSLVYVDYVNASGLPSDYCFCTTFKSSRNLVSAEHLYLKYTGTRSYAAMFYYCSKLEVAPTLPTTLASYCFTSMFQNCTNLTTAPELPATTLSSGCYNSMFRGCTGLTTAPDLPATQLASYCYQAMFRDCSNLIYIKCLATSGFNESYSLSSWVDGVSATGTFVKDANTTWPSGASGIPNDWAVVNA